MTQHKRDKTIADLMSDLIVVPAGTVIIGSTWDLVDAEMASTDIPDVRQEWLLKEIPRHKVAVDTFKIGRVPVTAYQAEVLKPWTGVRPLNPEATDHPADLGVSGAFQFCAALSHLTGRLLSPPSEEQWVRAARGDDTRVYPWGDDWTPYYANLKPARIGSTTPVGSFLSGASAYGLLDMAGNTDEVTRTLYAPFAGAPADVPDLERWALTPFVTKGGGFTHARDLARIDRRHGVYAATDPIALRLTTPLT